MQEELTQLSRRAFPVIRTYCRDKYGLDFHAIDLDRESRDDGVSDNHSHFRVAVDQIDYAQNVSMGPYFVVSDFLIAILSVVMITSRIQSRTNLSISMRRLI